MGSTAAGPAGRSTDGLAIGGFSPVVKKLIAVSPPDALLAAIVIESSSSSVAGRLRFPPHISSRKFGGEASIGTRLSTLPSEGRSHDSPLLAKPRSSSCAAFTARWWPDEEPSTTAIRRLPLRVADPTRL